MVTPDELVDAGVVVQADKPDGPFTSHVNSLAAPPGLTPATPVTVAVNVIVEGITPESLSVRTTDGTTCAIVTLTAGVGALNEL